MTNAPICHVALALVAAYSIMITILYLVERLALLKDNEINLFNKKEYELALRKIVELEKNNELLRADNRALVEQINIIGRNAT